MTCISKSHQSLRIKKSVTQSGGFTLLELIGVMVVIAILTAAVLPSTIDLIQVQRSVNDGSKLPEIAEALKRGMLREQVFPIYQNGNSVPTGGNDRYWWNLASRHGGGSANEVRYPLAVRSDEGNTRKIYFAQPSWEGQSFSEITSDGINWLGGLPDPLNPIELRILLLSTTSSDLPLPDTITLTEFNALWDNWAIGFKGDPATLEWFNYGLNEADWDGRATELNVQRIDLREWLSTVVIENRRAIQEAPLESLNGQISGNWVAGSLYAYAENLVDCEVLIKKSSAGSSGSPPVDLVNIEEVILLRRGKYILDDRTPLDESNKPSIVVGGVKFETDVNGAIIPTPTEIPFDLTLTDRSKTLEIANWEDGDEPIQERYFLPGQVLSLGVPWINEEIDDGSLEESKVGIFVIDEDFSTLRFDGLQWEY